MRWEIGWTIAALAPLALGPAQAQGAAQRASAIPAAAAVATQAQPVVVHQNALPPVAQPAPAGGAFQQYKLRLTALARAARIREQTIQSVIPGLELSNRVIELDRAQRPRSTAGTSYVPPMAPYIRDHVTSSLITRGQARYAAHWPNLSRIQLRFGVDPAVIMAIYGKETSYGSVTGNFDLLPALATLAYEGRRRAFFEEEFIAALRLLDQGVGRWTLKGSYAGATGYPQFMPSVALRLRADGDGDGYADIWRNEDDAFASIANYLRSAGWKPNVPWGIPVRVAPTLNRTAIQSHLNAPRCAAVFRRHSRWLTVAEWRALGVTPVYRTLPDTELATLMEPDGPGAGGYLLTTNYRAILDYNCSNFYAMSVGLLADRIARR
ncbi:lytic murein transglycosylase [Sphingomonas sinipercae]|uniref:lytic murein transglycosylase n=1 Tax=Sphingomonas sinipercae TaxID=2714944 RepID=UPI001FE72032|nr:lytic murein transglycosylase [Sphingomonas sinipercae]